MQIPDDYKGREQTYLKHRVLTEYVTAWGHKMASVGRQRTVRIWYVDCFAGPWNEKGDELADTSVSIGLRALNAAADTWLDRGGAVEVAAIFVEKNAKAHKRLVELVAAQKGRVAARVFHGTFGEHVSTIEKLLGDDAALLFVDPTGWKGAAMSYIAPLMAGRYRDVIVNVMFNFINRFAGDSRKFLRDQLREFFGGEVPDADEEELLRFYRAQLKQHCRLRVAADLAIPHPTHDRTWFRLVVGGKAVEVLELFREIEHRVVGREAAAIRDEAKRATTERQTGQLPLAGLTVAAPIDRRYEELHQRDLERARAAIPLLVAQHSSHVPMIFEWLWTELLQDHHLTRGEVGRLVMDLHRSKRIVVRGATPRQQVPRDEQAIKRP